MKIFCLISLFIIMPFAYGNTTFESALALFQQRSYEDEGIAKAKSAAKQFKTLFNQATLNHKIAKYALYYTKAQFFIGERTTNPFFKRNEYKEGFNIAQKGIELLEKKLGIAKKPEYTEILAKLYFWHSTALGRWGESVGLMKSLSKWPRIKKRLKACKRMGYENIVGHGVNRYLGRAAYLMPSPFGNKYIAKIKLLNAYKKTMHPTLLVSSFTLNNIYYAELLNSIGERQKAIEILNRLIQVADEGKVEELHDYYYKKYHDDRLSETYNEIEQARELLKTI
jgi:tetratricopeptide (TPR) repeat protein